MKQAVAYFRVSTAKQGASGLGLEGQRTAVIQFAAMQGVHIIAEYSETESGKGPDALVARPALARAMQDAKRRNAPVIVSKLDRLSRDVHFISGADGASRAVHRG